MIAIAKWREESSHVAQRLANPAVDQLNKRTMAVKEKHLKIRNLCKQFGSYTGPLLKEYLKLVSAAMVD